MIFVLKRKRDTIINKILSNISQKHTYVNERYKGRCSIQRKDETGLTSSIEVIPIRSLKFIHICNNKT